MTWTYYPISTSPASYDIVWCRFPYREHPARPGPKPRPAIVRQSLVDQDDHPWVRVVYGTSQDIFSGGRTSFVVSNLPEMDSAGLFRATRFDLAACEQLPWCREFFEPLFGNPTPVMGRLSDHMVKLLQMQASYLQRDGLI